LSKDKQLCGVDLPRKKTTAPEENHQTGRKGGICLRIENVLTKREAKKQGGGVKVN